MSGPVQSNLRMRLFLTLAIIALSAGAAIIALAYKMRPSPYATHVVNLAGKHRLYSQEIAKLALLKDRDGEVRNEPLRASIANFRKTSEELNSPEIEAFLREIGEGEAAARVQDKTRAFLAAAESFDSAAPVQRRMLLPEFMAADDSLLREANAMTHERGFWNGDFTDKKADGSLCVLNSTLAAVRVNGAVTGYIGVQRDVSRQRELEEEAARARDEAVRAMRSRNQFYAMLSHDFRAPLYSIMAAASLFENQDGRSDGGAASAIQTSASVVLDLINNILDFSRMETGQLELATRVFPLRRPVYEAEQIIRQQAQKKALAFQVHLADDLPASVLGDEARLRRVLLNLLGNAVKFTSSGSVTLRAQPNGGGVAFAVEDTGPGIPTADRERIFKPFEQGGNHDGIGLGLAICKELVALMGGTLTLDPQMRTCFRVHLPLVSVQPGTSPSGLRGIPGGS